MNRLTFFLLFLLPGCPVGIASAQQHAGVFSKDNLVAWCIVPFDAKQRGPEERAKMLRDLGITKLAYDWREQHIPTFDDELKALSRYGIGLEAFWMMSGQGAEHHPHIRSVFDFLERNKVKTQIWLMMTEWPGFDKLSQKEKVAGMGSEIRYIAEKAGKLGCKVALYNHGGWFGEPENQLEIIRYLDLGNLGIVYNFHHARQHYDRFPEFFPKIQPHLFCLNIAGLKEGVTDRFFRTGQGNLEKEMIRLVWKSGYNGPVGIIHHDEQEDAEKGLRDEMSGLQKILTEIGDRKAAASYR